MKCWTMTKVNYLQLLIHKCLPYISKRTVIILITRKRFEMTFEGDILWELLKIVSYSLIHVYLCSLFILICFSVKVFHILASIQACNLLRKFMITLCNVFISIFKISLSISLFKWGCRLVLMLMVNILLIYSSN